MENNNNQKIVLVSFVAMAAAAAWVVSVLMNVLAATWGTFARIHDSLIVRHGIPVVVGIGFFVYLVATPSVRQWGEEVVVEVSKVVWPSRRDTTAMTILVTAIILVASALLWGMDQISSLVVNQIMSIQL